MPFISAGPCTPPLLPNECRDKQSEYRKLWPLEGGARELAFRALFQAERGDEPLLDVWAGIRDDLTEQTPGEAEEVYGEGLDADGAAFADPARGRAFCRTSARA